MEFAPEVSFTIVDDPLNSDVYKGLGCTAAKRGELAMREIQQLFPAVRFVLQSSIDCTLLTVRARIDLPVDIDLLMLVLDCALMSSGTRLAPGSRDYLYTY